MISDRTIAVNFLRNSEKCGSLEGGVAKINRHYSVERFPWWDEEGGVRFPSHFQMSTIWLIVKG